jgi:hypothetical protein
MQSRIDVTNNLTGDEEAGLVIERRFTSVRLATAGAI